MGESSHHDRCCSYFKEWMDLQAQDLDELQNALANNPDQNVCNQLVEKVINHCQDYMDKRSTMSHQDASGYFAPSWCTSLEIASFWIAGCRPSSYIRLIYAIGGSHVESMIAELMQGRSNECTGELTSNQLTMINNLHMKIVKEEDKLTSKLASLQENMADDPISVIANRLSLIGPANEEVDQAVGQNDSSMANVIDEADKLRLDTLKELVKILTPSQAVDFLASSKKLHLCIHEWGKTRDDKFGRKSK